MLRSSEQPDPPLIKLVNYFSRSAWCQLRSIQLFLTECWLFLISGCWSNGFIPLHSLFTVRGWAGTSLGLSALSWSPLQTLTYGHRSLELRGFSGWIPKQSYISSLTLGTIHECYSKLHFEYLSYVIVACVCFYIKFCHLGLLYFSVFVL